MAEDDRLERAAGLVDEGRVPEALVLLLAAADDASSHGRPHAAARALRLASTTARIGGAAEQALQLAVRAGDAARAAGDHALRRDAAGQAAQALRAVGRPAQSAQAYADLAAEDGTEPEQRLALVVQATEADVAAGRADAALTRLAHLADELTMPSPALAARALLVALPVGVEAGLSDGRLDRLDVRARDLADGDARVLADLDLVAAARRLRAGDPSAALRAATGARVHALEAVQPLTYWAAVLAVAGAHEALGDRAEAYRALVTGQSTLADVLGPELAGELGRRAIGELSDRWGRSALQDVHEAYVAARREQLRRPG